jgi:mannose-6-phosphate isomerase-like protein (cupin superfamily)
MKSSNIAAGENCAVLLSAQTPVEKVQEGLERKTIRTGRLMTVVIDFTGGPWERADPYHSHPHEQTSYIASGDVIFLAEGEEPRRLSAGDLFAVPPNKPHSIQLLSVSARLVDSFHPVREDFLA